MHRILPLTCLLLALTACDDPPPAVFLQCELRLQVEPAQVEPGDTVTLSGRPMSEAADTDVRIGGVPASIVAFDDAAGPCTSCEDCRFEARCTTCERCPTCDESCAACIPSVTVEVPELDPGDYPISLVNRFGVSQPVDLTVLPVPPEQDGT